MLPSPGKYIPGGHVLQLQLHIKNTNNSAKRKSEQYLISWKNIIKNYNRTCDPAKDDLPRLVDLHTWKFHTDDELLGTKVNKWTNTKLKSDKEQ